MATTNLIPLHPGKNGRMDKAIYRVIGYVENPDKTRNGDLITGYECDPHTAAGEFALMKKEYLIRTGRVRGSDDVIAYHLRQSFAPGEITRRRLIAWVMNWQCVSPKVTIPLTSWRGAMPSALFHLII